MSAWKPIETAPSVTKRQLVLMYLVDPHRVYAPCMGIYYSEVRDCHGMTPTHWMPLPDPPTDDHPARELLVELDEEGE